jgi:hypothetical protein
MKKILLITSLLFSTFLYSQKNEKSETTKTNSNGKIKTSFTDTTSTKKHELITNSQSNEKLKNTEIQKEDKTKTVFNWGNFWSAIAGGIIGLFPKIINYFKKKEIKGRLISQYHNTSYLNKRHQEITVQKISLFSTNQNFFLKNFEVFLKQKGSAEFKCDNWTWRELNFTFTENKESIEKSLNIDCKDYLLHHTVFPKEQSIIGYISFSYDSERNKEIEYIKYLFSNYKGKVKELKINNTEIDSKTLSFDNSIWKLKTTPNKLQD